MNIYILCTTLNSDYDSLQEALAGLIQFLIEILDWLVEFDVL